ncbi:MAG: hypothetical protein M1828_003315 [Chrysothrix sp. TS-e1954]|nr:MAG: hypothetical protein M1828_003315 [Chrysothrix sp. TS-e1954]
MDDGERSSSPDGEAIAARTKVYVAPHHLLKMPDIFEPTSMKQLGCLQDITQFLRFGSEAELKEFWANEKLFGRFFNEHVETYLAPNRHSNNDYHANTYFKRVYYIVLSQGDQLLDPACDRATWAKEHHLAYMLLKMFHANAEEEDGLFFGETLTTKSQQIAFEKLWIVFVRRRAAWLRTHPKTVPSPLRSVNMSLGGGQCDGQITVTWPRPHPLKPLSVKIGNVTQKTWDEAKLEIMKRFEPHILKYSKAFIILPLPFAFLKTVCPTHNKRASLDEIQNAIDEQGLSATWSELAKFVHANEYPLVLTLADGAIKNRGVLQDMMDINSIRPAKVTQLNNFSRSRQGPNTGSSTLDHDNASEAEQESSEIANEAGNTTIEESSMDIDGE